MQYDDLEYLRRWINLNDLVVRGNFPFTPTLTWGEFITWYFGKPPPQLQFVARDVYLRICGPSEPGEPIPYEEAARLAVAVIGEGQV